MSFSAEYIYEIHEVNNIIKSYICSKYDNIVKELNRYIRSYKENVDYKFYSGSFNNFLSWRYFRRDFHSSYSDYVERFATQPLNRQISFARYLFRYFPNYISE